MAKYTDEKMLEIEQEKQQKKLLRNKDVKASIRALVEAGKYDEVFVNYGREAYRRSRAYPDVLSSLFSAFFIAQTWKRRKAPIL